MENNLIKAIFANMSIITPKMVKKVLELLLNKHHISRRYPAYCIFDKKKNPIMKLSEKRFDKLSIVLLEKDKNYTLSKKLILGLNGNNIIKTVYKEIRNSKKKHVKDNRDNNKNNQCAVGNI